MDKRLLELKDVYKEVEDVLQTAIGNPISVQNKVQKVFKNLEAARRAFTKFILKEKDKLTTDDIALELYTKYPSYLDEAFLIKLEQSGMISPYNKEYDTKHLATELYKIYNSKNAEVNGNTGNTDIKKHSTDNLDINNYNIKSGVVFPLTPMQKILRNFMNSHTPYKGLLLIHGTGVGKTCTGIQIAENLKSMIKKMKTKIYVIRFDEFKRQIFENNTLRKGQNVNLQCTGDTYIREIEETNNAKDIIAECKLGNESQCLKTEKMITKQIKKYYEGYSTPYQWATMVQQLIRSKTRNLSGLEKHQKIIKVIRATFNNSLLIIDEAHNLRNIGNIVSKPDTKKSNTKSKSKSKTKSKTKNDTTKNDINTLNTLIETDADKVDMIDTVESDDKTAQSEHFITEMIKIVLIYSQNMRLLLLSATPMYDKSQDIIPLLNFLRMNDKLPNITPSHIFDIDGNLTQNGKHLLRSYSSGYISYVRGNDPVEFPIRLDADVNIPNKIMDLTQYPDVDILGKKIKKQDKLKFMKLVKCPFSVAHQNALLSIIGKVDDVSGKVDDVSGKVDDVSGKVDDVSLEDFDIEKNDIIEPNFSVAYNTEIQMGNFMYQTLKESNSRPRFCYGENGFNAIAKKLPRVNTYKFEDEELGKRFMGDELKKHGPKIYECIQNIEKSDGPVFVYTYYTSGGVLPMAFALEMLGYTRYGGVEPILENKYKSNANKGEYIIYTGNNQLRKGADAFFNLRQKMVNNKRVKVVIASKKGSEGLNLFGFREIHILDPWHNINLLEQTIGRVIRRRSHYHLPPEKRNVVVYMYSTILSGDKKHMESIDMRVYRICEKKAVLSLNVLKVLKQNAIDCTITKAVNYRDSKDYNHDIECLTSHGKLIKYTPSDNDINKLYSVSKYKCFVEEDKENMSPAKLKKITTDITKTNNLLDMTLLNFDIELKDILSIFRKLLIKNYNLYREDSINIIKEILPISTQSNKELIINIYDVVINNLENDTLQLNTISNNSFIFGKIIKVRLQNGDELLRVSPYYNQNPDISLYQQYYDYMSLLASNRIIYNKIARKLHILSSKNPYIFKPIANINLLVLIKDLEKIKLKYTSRQILNYMNILLSIQNDADNVFYKDDINLSNLDYSISDTNDNKNNKDSNNNKDTKDNKDNKNNKDTKDNFSAGSILTNLNIKPDYGFNELYKYIFDKLLINEKIFLLQNLVYRIKAKYKLSVIEKIILNVVQFNLVNRGEFIISQDINLNKVKANYYENYIRTPANLYGFIVADYNNLYLYKLDETKIQKQDITQSNNIDIRNYFIIDKLKLKTIITRRWQYMSKQNLNKIYCHNAYSKSTYLKPIFKITDYAGKGYKKSVKGVWCYSNKLGQITGYINKIDPTFKIKTVKNKKMLCDDLELLARIKHNKDNPDITAPGITLYILSPEEYYIWSYHQT